MKVILVNGSPHPNGCTSTALKEIETALKNDGIDAEIYWIGNKPIPGCIACNICKSTGECFRHDDVNEFIEKYHDADAFIFGSPVYFASMSSQLKAFMERVFYSKKSMFIHKPGAAVVSCRRGGASATFDEINKYFTISSMLVIGSQYWNQVHGSTPEDVAKDAEGLQTMRTLAHNMAWTLKCIDAGKAAGIVAPTAEEWERTDFIR